MGFFKTQEQLSLFLIGQDCGLMATQSCKESWMIPEQTVHIANLNTVVVLLL